MCMAAVRELNHRDIVHTGFSSSDFLSLFYLGIRFNFRISVLCLKQRLACVRRACLSLRLAQTVANLSHGLFKVNVVINLFKLLRICLVCVLLLIIWWASMLSISDRPHRA